MSGGFFKHPKASATGLVFSQVLTVDSATLDTGANAIPANGSVLSVYALLRTDEATTASTAMIRFNNDSNTNYDGSFIQVLNASLTGGNTIGATGFAFNVAGASCTSGVVSAMTLTSPDYAGSVFNKPGLAVISIPDQAASSARLQQRSFEWRSVVAINQVSLSVSSGSGQKFKAGSGMWVYVQ